MLSHLAWSVEWAHRDQVGTGGTRCTHWHALARTRGSRAGRDATRRGAAQRSAALLLAFQCLGGAEQVSLVVLLRPARRPPGR